MRKVIDDAHYGEISEKIYDLLMGMPADEVVDKKRNDGRPSANMIKAYIDERLENARIGKNVSRNSIANNHCFEIIYTGDPSEEQVCGHLNANEDLVGNVYTYVTDYDDEKRWNHPVRKVLWCDSNSDDERRFGGWTDK